MPACAWISAAQSTTRDAQRCLAMANNVHDTAAAAAAAAAAILAAPSTATTTDTAQDNEIT